MLAPLEVPEVLFQLLVLPIETFNFSSVNLGEPVMLRSFAWSHLRERQMKKNGP